MKLYTCRCCEKRKMRLLFDLTETGELDFVCAKCRSQEAQRIEFYNDCKDAFTDSYYKLCQRCRGIKPTSRFNRLNSKIVDLHPANVHRHCKACATRYTKAYQDRNRDQHLEYQRNYAERRKIDRSPAANQRRKEQAAAWQKANPIKVRANSHRYRTRKTKAGGSYTVQEWEALCIKYNNRCLCCGLEKPLAADHVIPVAKGGSSNISNIQPLCRECNSSKGTKDTDYRPSF